MIAPIQNAEDALIVFDKYLLADKIHQEKCMVTSEKLAEASVEDISW